MKRKNIIILVIYFLAIIVFNLKIDNYQKRIAVFPDECSHIAYIAYLEQSNKLIPEFNNMKELSIGSFLKDNDYKQDRENEEKIRNGVNTGDDISIDFNENTINHLCHPPLYYHIMRLFNQVHVVNNTVTYNLRNLRNISQILSNIGLILAFLIGYKKLKSVLANLIYASLLITIPLFTCVGGAVTNDVLSLIGIAVFVLGMMRLEDNDRNNLTFCLIYLGIAICALNKITALVMVSISYIVINAIIVIREKSIKHIFCKQNLISIPFFATIFVYYIIVFIKCGTVTPSLMNLNFDYYKTTEFYDSEIYVQGYTLKYYGKIFWKGFLNYWAGYGYYREIKSFYMVIPSALIISFPFLNIIYMKAQKKKLDITNITICLSSIIAMCIQFTRQCIEFYTVSGYLGGNQPRYYLCVMPSFMLLISSIVENSIAKDERNKKKIAYSIVFLIYIFLIEIGLW